jgi:hypothetical protein
MKKLLLQLPLLLLLYSTAIGQSAWGYIPSNRYVSTLEKNLLFYAHSRRQVTISGSNADTYNSNKHRLFDGVMEPIYSATTIDPNYPLVIEISNLPNSHTQQGAFIGWSTRWYPSKKFKIEVYNTYAGANEWRTIANVDNNSKTEVMYKALGTVSRIRITFYEGFPESSGQKGRLGVSEIFFIHTEAARAYDGLMVQYDRNLNVGIGTSNTHGYKLAVAGKVIAEEVVVKLQNQWPDYVFKPEYTLRPLAEVEAHIATHGHLPEVPSTQQVEEIGIGLAEMNALLLKKVEELTLYSIDQEKRLERQGEEIKELKKLIKDLLNR